jgi:NadR type nicotinamide-nucleotide adenylyltransferase
MDFKTSLVVGKFYPPHKGHHFLIDSALSRSGQTIVLVCDTPGLAIPAELRASWLRDVHPTADVRVVPDIGKDDDSRAWAKHTVGFLGFAPDAVFSSEAYGDGYAQAMGCTHVCVDKARLTFPVSGTAVRTDPFSNWEFLEPPVRAHYAKRVVVIGAESTGTTTLARALAAQYRTAWVPEFGRLYAEGKYGSGDPIWRTDEFAHIAGQQSAMEDHLARSANKVLICDTDPFATTLWHERYMGFRSAEVEKIAAARTCDLYLLTGDEIPFEQDGLRDGEHLRHAMHSRFEEELRRKGVPWSLLRGPHENRLAEATGLIDKMARL